MSAMSDDELAWASIDAEACTRTLYFAIRVLSAAISTSTIRPLAASMLVLVVAILSEANAKRDMDAPLSARKVATFCSAWVKIPTETSAKLIAPDMLADANELMLFPAVAPSENLAAAKVDE